MDLLTRNEDQKQKILAAKASEIKELKRKLEDQLEESREIKKYFGDSFDDFVEIPANDSTFLAADDIIGQYPSLMKTELLTTPIVPIGISPVELKKERGTQLYQYGFEVKYLPLARYLQTATKYISTTTWSAAREEFRTARIFDKFIELRSSKALTSVQIRQQQYPLRNKTIHDYFLDEVLWMSNDFKEESEWKQVIAKQLAFEAAEFVAQKRKFSRFDANDCFYDPAVFQDSFTGNVQNVNEIPIESDNYRTLTRIGGEVVSKPASTEDLIPAVEYRIVGGRNVPTSGWYEHEDALLLQLAPSYLFNWTLVSTMLNNQIYYGRRVRSRLDCQRRHEHLREVHKTSESDVDLNQSGSYVHPSLLEKHAVKFGLMRGENTKIITPRSIVQKKISFNVHPSHEAAARKANQNISKLLTPSELAQKRLQRTRLVNEGSGISIPQIPRSTPSPNLSNSGSQASQPTQPGQQASLQQSQASQQSIGQSKSMTSPALNASTSSFPQSGLLTQSGPIRPPTAATAAMMMGRMSNPASASQVQMLSNQLLQQQQQQQQLQQQLQMQQRQQSPQTHQAHLQQPQSPSKSASNLPMPSVNAASKASMGNFKLQPGQNMSFRPHNPQSAASMAVAAAAALSASAGSPPNVNLPGQVNMNRPPAASQILSYQQLGNTGAGILSAAPNGSATRPPGARPSGNGRQSAQPRPPADISKDNSNNSNKTQSDQIQK